PGRLRKTVEMAPARTELLLCDFRAGSRHFPVGISMAAIVGFELGSAAIAGNPSNLAEPLFSGGAQRAGPGEPLCGGDGIRTGVAGVVPVELADVKTRGLMPAAAR